MKSAKVVAPSAKEVDVFGLTIAEVQAGFASGKFSAEDLARSCLEHVCRYNKTYNAIVFLNPSALDDARAIDSRRAAGERLGPLAGVPMVVKDSIDMIGFPTTAGWSLLHGKCGGVDLIPRADAPVVERIRGAGAVILGKTNMPALAYSANDANTSWAGPTLNVPMPDRWPGGSSTGTAAAVASGMAILGLGSETGGSIQNPAAFQDLVGVKPTIGLVPNSGVFPLSSNRDVVGPIAQCVRDAALCLDALAGYTMEDPKTLAAVGKLPREGYTSGLRAHALEGKRLGLFGMGWRKVPMSEECAELYERAKRELERLGAILVEDPFAGSGFAEIRETLPDLPNFHSRGLESIPYDIEKYLQHLGPQAALKTFAEFARATEAGNAFGPEGLMGNMMRLPQFKAALQNPCCSPDISEFIDLKEQLLVTFEQVFCCHGLDGCVFPQTLRELPAVQSNEEFRATAASEMNIAGLPGVTVPAGYYQSGSPFSLIFIGREWSDGDVLAFAFAYESATKHRRLPSLSSAA